MSREIWKVEDDWKRGGRVTDRVTDEQVITTKRMDSNPLGWYVLAVLSPRVAVPAIRRVIENAGLAGHGLALVIAVVVAIFIGVTIVLIGRIEQLVYRYALALLWIAVLFSLWYYTT
jgi:hypothetical protein